MLTKHADSRARSDPEKHSGPSSSCGTVAPMAPGSVGFVQRELDGIAVALRETTNPERYGRLYAAQQALCWALDPEGYVSPLETVSRAPLSDTPEG